MWISLLNRCRPPGVRLMFVGWMAGSLAGPLHAADGTPLVLTDSRQAAIGHAMGDELEIASIH